MKRLALLALLLAAPAQAGRVCVIPPTTYINGTPNIAIDQTGRVLDLLQTMGVQYDVMPQSAVPTGQITSGTVMLGGGVAQNYSAFIHIGYAVGTGSAAYHPDSLWTAARWSAVPNIFFGPVNTSGISYGNASSCSTSVSLWANFSVADRAMSADAYVPGSRLKWKEPGVYYQGAVRIAGNGTVRSVIACEEFPQALIGSFDSPYQFYITPNDPGSIGETAAQSDSFLLLAKYGASGNVAGHPASVPYLFCFPNGSNGSNPSVWLMAAALAAADSASGRQIIGQAPGWQPRKMGIYIGRAFGRNDPTLSTINFERGAMICTDPASGSTCDSVVFKASMDSLNALNVPITVGVNADSIASYPYETAWWKRIRAVEFAPESWTGFITGGVSDTTGPAKSVDIWGQRRARAYLPTYGRGFGTPCLPGDTSITCLLTYARNRMAAAGLTPLSSALMAPGYDYVASQYSRAMMPTLDTLGMALLTAGYDHIVLDPLNPDMRNSSYAVNGSGTSQASVTNPAWIYNFEGRYPIFNGDHSVRYGTLTAVACREPLLDPLTDGSAVNPLKWLAIPIGSGGGMSVTHFNGNEFFQGLLTPRWYGIGNTNTPFYFHNFKTPLSVYAIRAGALGSDVAVGNTSRPEYFYLKWVVNQVRVLNQLAGRTVIQILPVDKL